MSRVSATRSVTPDRPVSNRRTIVILAAAVFLWWGALYLYVPTLPVYVESKSDSLAMVGVVLSMYGLWQALIRLPVGIVSDWLGRRKPFIIGGFVLTGLGAWYMGAADTASGLLVGRAITGLAAGTWVPAVVLFSSLFPPDDAIRATAWLTLVGSVSRVIVTAMTGSLNALGGYPLAFYLAAGLAVSALLMVLSVKEAARVPRRPSPRAIGELGMRVDVMLPTLLSTLHQYANWASTFAFIPILAAQLGATGVVQSLLLSTNMAVMILGNLLTSTLDKRIGSYRLTVIAFSSLGAGVLVAAVAPSIGWLFAAQLCIGLSTGIASPVLMGLSILRVADKERAVAMGFHQAIYAVGMFAGPAVSGVVAEAIGIRPMFGVTGALCLVLGLLGARWIRAYGARN